MISLSGFSIITHCSRKASSKLSNILSRTILKFSNTTRTELLTPKRRKRMKNRRKIGRWTKNKMTRRGRRRVLKFIKSLPAQPIIFRKVQWLVWDLPVPKLLPTHHGCLNFHSPKNSRISTITLLWSRLHPMWRKRKPRRAKKKRKRRFSLLSMSRRKIPFNSNPRKKWRRIKRLRKLRRSERKKLKKWQRKLWKNKPMERKKRRRFSTLKKKITITNRLPIKSTIAQSQDINSHSQG